MWNSHTVIKIDEHGQVLETRFNELQGISQYNGSELQGILQYNEN